MSVVDSARQEAQRRWNHATATSDDHRELRGEFRVGFMKGAAWALEHHPTRDEIAALIEIHDDWCYDLGETLICSTCRAPLDPNDRYPTYSLLKHQADLILELFTKGHQ